MGLIQWIFDTLAGAWVGLEHWWKDTQGWHLDVLHNLTKTLLLVIAFLLLRRFLIEPASRLFKHPRRRYHVRKAGNAILSVVTLVSIAAIWISTKDADWFQFISIASAGLAIALKDPLLNVFGWMYITVREPFDVKDRIEVYFDDHRVKGDVIDIRLSMFSLLEVGNWVDAEQSTGRILHIPNGAVFNHVVANYTQGFKHIWNELPVTVTFESNWEKAHRVLTQIVGEQTKDAVKAAQEQVHDASTRYMVYYTRFTPIVWVKVEDIGVTLTLRYLCDTRRRRSSEHALWSSVLKEFAKHNDIDFAYPTMRFYDNRGEGKRQLRKPETVIHAERPPDHIEETSDFESEELGEAAAAAIAAGESVPFEEVELSKVGHIVTSEHTEEETGIFDASQVRKLTEEFQKRVEQQRLADEAQGKSKEKGKGKD